MRGIVVKDDTAGNGKCRIVEKKWVSFFSTRPLIISRPFSLCLSCSLYTKRKIVQEFLWLCSVEALELLPDSSSETEQASWIYFI